MLKKKIYILLVALISFVLFVWGALYLNERLFQGEYYHYEDGVTIEVTNSSDQTVNDLKYYFTVVPQELGEISSLEPGERKVLYTPKIEGEGSDRSLYFEYPLNNTSLVKETLAYLSSYIPSKVVIVLEIIDVDHIGRISYQIKGYEDIFGRFEYDNTH